jgi:hypothetical protein
MWSCNVKRGSLTSECSRKDLIWRREQIGNAIYRIGAKQFWFFFLLQALYVFDTIDKKRMNYLGSNANQSKYLIFIANSVSHDLPGKLDHLLLKLWKIFINKTHYYKIAW